MASFLWGERWRDFFKNQLDFFQRAVERVSESFSHENLEEDAFEAAAGGHPEEGMEIAAEHYINMIAAYNGIRASFTASLYHMWEQQVRNFLFNEISRDEEVDRQPFCTDLNLIKRKLLEYGVDIETFACWPIIYELNKITNSIKHGDGPSFEWIKMNHPGLVPNRPCCTIPTVGRSVPS